MTYNRMSGEVSRAKNYALYICSQHPTSYTKYNYYECILSITTKLIIAIMLISGWLYFTDEGGCATFPNI